MKDLLEICCGLDVQKDKIVACVLSGGIGKTATSETKEFSTLYPDMRALRDWLLSQNCRHVAMESTGIYWQPIYEVLEDAPGGMMLLVVNARHMKNVPGKKTDMRDAEWIATLLRAGLLSGSFIPDKDIREFRRLTRYRKSIVHEVTSQKNRIEKFLQSTGFRLSTFISDVFGASGRNIISHLIEHGRIDHHALDKCLKAGTRCKINDILIATNGMLSEEQQEFLKMLMSHLNMIQHHLSEVEESIRKATLRFESAIEILCSINGIGITSSSAIIAEIGIDMSRFKTAEHLCSWAGLSPGNNESAGKKKSARITKGNPYIKSMLCEVAWVIAGKRNLYLSRWYWRIKQKKGAKKAIIALARKLLVIIYTMLRNGTFFDETLFESRRASAEQQRTKRYIHELENLGYKIEIQQA
jgi:transposase